MLEMAMHLRESINVVNLSRSGIGMQTPRIGCFRNNVACCLAT